MEVKEKQLDKILSPFSKEAREKIKVIGSCVYKENPNDFDLVTYDIDTYSDILHEKVNDERYHPILRSKEIFDNIENLSTFYKDCFCYYNGAIIYGTLYKEDSIEINQESLKIFKSKKYKEKKYYDAFK